MRRSLQSLLILAVALGTGACQPDAGSAEPGNAGTGEATGEGTGAPGPDNSERPQSNPMPTYTGLTLPSPGAESIPAPPDVAAPPANADRTPTGLASIVLRPGTGTDHPGEADRVTVQYTGWTTDGEMFDSSVVRGEPAEFPLDRVIAGWTEGVQLMVVGEQRRFWIPVELAYNNRPGRPAGMLVFDVELVSFQVTPPPPPAPPDVAAPPADAERTASGLASRVLRPGTGSVHPTATSMVRVHYSGWTTDGEMFDSSVTRNEPAEFPLNGVIAGWTEGVQLMVVGEQRRFWIPVELAYNNRPGRPAGMLVFDVELLDILQ